MTISRKHFTSLVVAAISIWISANAHAAVTVAITTQAANGNPHSGTISASSSDLLQTQGTLAGSAATRNLPANLTNGIIATTTGNSSADRGAFGAGAGNFVEYDLNISVNTLGYDITSIASISHWSDARAGQAYTVLIRKVGESSFTSLYTLSGQSASNVVHEVLLTNSGGGTLTEGAVVASGIDGIRFEFANAPSTTWAGYREIDVFGSATIPEPSVSILIGLAGLFLMMHRRRS